MSSSQPASKLGRNDRCECNSGKKVKACCGEKKAEKPAAPKAMTAANKELLYPSRSTIDEFLQNLREKAKELAVDLFNCPESWIKIITCTGDYSKMMFRSHVQLNKPGWKPVLESSAPTMQDTREKALEVLIMSLQNRLAIKKEIISTKERRDKALEIEAIKETVGEGSRS